MDYELIEIHTEEKNGSIIKATDKSGLVVFIPLDPANAGYQAYLNRDNPDWGKPLL
jgi:hypothetical protein